MDTPSVAHRAPVDRAFAHSVPSNSRSPSSTLIWGGASPQHASAPHPPGDRRDPRPDDRAPRAHHGTLSYHVLSVASAGLARPWASPGVFPPGPSFDRLPPRVDPRRPLHSRRPGPSPRIARLAFHDRTQCSRVDRLPRRGFVHGPPHHRRVAPHPVDRRAAGRGPPFLPRFHDVGFCARGGAITPATRRVTRKESTRPSKARYTRALPRGQPTRRRPA